MRRCDRPAVTLALSLIGAVFSLLSPLPASAETPVGLEAQGVDPNAALDNAQGLDVRDAMGRPVSADVIRKQLKAAEAEAAAQASFASKLPQAKRVTLMLELLTGGAASLRAALARGFARFLADAGLPKPPQELPAAAVLVFSFALAAVSASAVLCCPDFSPACFSVLRC